MDAISPQALVDIYLLLPKPQQLQFLQILGQNSAAEQAYMVTMGLSSSEQNRFWGKVKEIFDRRFLPSYLHAALMMTRDLEARTDEQFKEELKRRISENEKISAKGVEALMREELKAERDRKSDPNIVRRNVKLCDLRKKDPRTWSYGKLARHFDIKRPTVRKILGEEQKWRQLGSALGTN